MEDKNILPIIENILQTQREYQSEARAITNTLNQMAISMVEVRTKLEELKMDVQGQANFADRLTKMETRTEEQEKQRTKDRAELDVRINGNRWLIGTVIGIVLALAGFAASHVVLH